MLPHVHRPEAPVSRGVLQEFRIIACPAEHTPSGVLFRPPAVCRPVKIDGVPYFDGGIADSIPVGRALEDGCDKLVVLLSKPRDYIRQPQKMKALYTLRCRAYPRIVEALDHRHTAYNLNLRKVYDLEKAGKAFIFAPETRVRTGTFSVDEKTAHELYDIGMADFRRESARLMEYIEG